VPPCTPDVVRLFEDGEVVVSEKTFELDGHSKA
jgi:hypothetical protein